MKYALIGCGRIATNHMLAVKNNNLELVAVCDVKPEAMEALLAKHGLEGDETIARYTDHKALLANHPELELVYASFSDALFRQMEQAQEVNKIAFYEAQVAQILQLVFGEFELAKCMNFFPYFVKIDAQVYIWRTTLIAVLDVCGGKLVQHHLHHGELVQVGIEQ